uniref:DNA translocase FtsK n=2 Tax=Lygus hesperus TaxID=30085 RepID=A0A0A9ZDQ0_LYGHE
MQVNSEEEQKKVQVMQGNPICKAVQSDDKESTQPPVSERVIEKKEYPKQVAKNLKSGENYQIPASTSEKIPDHMRIGLTHPTEKEVVQPGPDIERIPMVRKTQYAPPVISEPEGVTKEPSIQTTGWTFRFEETEYGKNMMVKNPKRFKQLMDQRKWYVDADGNVVKKDSVPTSQNSWTRVYR